jgi:uncharacterized protein
MNPEFFTFGTTFLIALAAIGAGGINAIVGSGTLITFPVLVALGVPPLTANVSNNIGLVPGGVTAFWGTRDELPTTSSLLRPLLPWSVLGGLAGAILLVTLPESAFRSIVPVLILLGVALVLLSPRMARLHGDRARPLWILGPLTMAAGMYGGYFGAAQGVILIGLMTSMGAQGLRAANAIKNALAALVNAIAGGIFILVADVDWVVVVIIAIGSSVGAYLGARYGRGIPAPVYRAVIAAVGIVAAVAFMLT